jgi:flagellum-specific ATP synthase
MLPKLLERAGRTTRGSITGFYAVLVEGDDLTDPIADAARGVLDGHLVLSKKLANRGHWPAIDAVQSISRVADDVTDAAHRAARRDVIALVEAYDRVEDLVNIGAYAAGSNPQFDLAIAARSAIDTLLQQGRKPSQTGDFNRTREQLLALTKRIEIIKQQLDPPRKSAPQGPQ